MTKKTRLIILLVCVACFLVIAPILVAYSMGYRFDFQKMKITSTGGIYVRTFPAAEQIIIDSKTQEKPGIFSNSIFVQSLLPNLHTVLIKKNGYYDYSKTISVQEKQVTKLENILLIKKSIEFRNFADKIDYFSVAPNNQNIITATTGAKNITLNYSSLNSANKPQTFSIIQAGLTAQSGKLLDIKWSDGSSKALIKIQNLNIISYYIFDSSKTIQQTTPLSYLDKNSQQIYFNPQNSQELFYIENRTLYSLKNNTVSVIIKNIITYKLSGGNILWLSSDGFLSSSDISGKLIEKKTIKNIAPSANKNYKIIMISGQTFLAANDVLLIYNSNTKNLEDFKAPIDNYSVLSSPDGQNMVYYNSKDIYLYPFLKNSAQNNVKIFSAKSSETISNCFWLNNDYIIFESGNKIIISEIDYRGNINAVELPQSYSKSAESKNPQIFFNQQDGKLYVLTNNILLSSEKLIP